MFVIGLMILGVNIGMYSKKCSIRCSEEIIHERWYDDHAADTGR
jgi:hypothetical protein